MKRFLGRPLGVCVVVLAMVLFFAGCGNNNGGPRGGLQPGYQTGTAPGFAGTIMGGATSITVRVLFGEGTIESIVLTDATTEREPFRSAVANSIIPAIIEHQSLDVDIVSGATASSEGLIAAVRNAITLAGGAGMFQDEVTRPAPNAPVTLTPDILVVGSGVSGLAAAIAAAEENPSADILLIEKLGFLGGVTATSGGMIHGANSVVMRARTNDPNNVFLGDTAEIFAAELLDLSLELPTRELIQPMLTQIAGLSSNTIDWLIAMGIEFPISTTDPNNLGLSGNPNRAWRGSPFSRALTPAGSGPMFVRRMVERAEYLEIDLRTNMEAVSLIGSSAGVTGVSARDITGGTVTINAGSVILATGGFHNSNELMQAHHPRVIAAGGHPNRWHLPGAYGQGLVMAIRDASAGVRTIYTPIAGIAGTPPWGIWVTPEGDRFFDESWQYGMASTAVLNKLGFYYQWTIMDNTNRPATLTAGTNNVFTAPTLELLVVEMGIPEAYRAEFLSNLNAAIDAYNDALPLATGARLPDELFGSELGDNTVPVAGQEPRPRHVAIGEGPFWAQRSGMFNDIWGTNSGLNINLDGQVLTEAGAIIPGLYAAGEVVGWILPIQYGGSGKAITIWANQARIAGRAAANN